MTTDPFQPPRAPLEPAKEAEARTHRAAKRFAVCSVAVGLLEVFDAATLYARDGTLGPVSLVTGVIELLWVLVSAYVLIRVRHIGATFLALVFPLWVAFTYVLVALGHISMAGIPTPFVFLGGAFGVAYALGAGYVSFGAMKAQRAA